MSETKTTAKKNKYALGDILSVPFHGSSGTIYFSCVVTDTRRSYGRPELEVTPLEGEGRIWVREDRLEDGSGPTTRSKGWQISHNLSNKSGTGVPDEETS